MPRPTLFSCSVALALLTACSSNGSDRICAPNLTTACICANDTTGQQVCKEDGSGFGACLCGMTGLDAGPSRDVRPRPDSSGVDQVSPGDLGADRVTLPDGGLPDPDLVVGVDAGSDASLPPDLGGADAGPTITTFFHPRSDVVPGAITTGSDGALWFTGGDSIGRITTEGVITEFPLGANVGTTQIARGPDGNIWFTQQFTQEIASITPAGTITRFGTNGVVLFGITGGPDGNIWYAGSTSIVRQGTNGSGLMSFFTPGTGPITTGPDGNLWFIDGQSNVGRITTAGVIVLFPLNMGDDTRQITSGPDGNLWVTQQSTHAISRVTTTGSFTQFPLDASVDPTRITTGPDGALWFTDTNNQQIGRITVDGTVTLMPFSGQPDGITTGPDNALWITVVQGRIVRLVP